jgi:uncharacterized membrane protein
MLFWGSKSILIYDGLRIFFLDSVTIALFVRSLSLTTLSAFCLRVFIELSFDVFVDCLMLLLSVLLLT